MKNHRFTFLAVAVFTFFVMAISSCGSSNSNVLQSSTGSTSTGATGGTVTADAFSVSVFADPDQPLTNKNHQFGNFAADCKIPATTATNQDIQCLVNVREHDLFQRGLRLVVNVPQSMCTYLAQQPYYYWNFKPGQGPAIISIDAGHGAPGAVAGSCLVTNDVGGAAVAGVYSNGVCTMPAGQGTVSTGGVIKCAYDYSWQYPATKNAPNCCTGKYSASVTSYTYDSTAMAWISSVSPAAGDYGGKAGNCYDGPHRMNSNYKVSGGAPVTTFTYVASSGTNQYYDISPSLAVRDGNQNVLAANMYAWSAYRANTWGAAALPKGMNPGTDLGGHAIPATNPAYTYSCLDASSELKHRIRVYINEWNTNEAYDSYISSAGVSGNPDVTGAVGTACAVGSAVSTSADCNDYLDWDDLGVSFPSQNGVTFD